MMRLVPEGVFHFVGVDVSHYKSQDVGEGVEVKLRNGTEPMFLTVKFFSLTHCGINFILSSFQSH